MRIWVIHVTRNCLCERETLKVTNRENDRIQKGWNRQMMNIFLELPNMRVEEIFYSQYQGFNKKASCKKQPRIFSSLWATLGIENSKPSCWSVCTHWNCLPPQQMGSVSLVPGAKKLRFLELKSISPFEEVRRLIERWKKVIEAILV